MIKLLLFDDNKGDDETWKVYVVFVRRNMHARYQSIS